MCVLVFIAAAVPFSLNAQEVHEELKETVRAEVLEVLDTTERDIIGTDTTATVQTLQVRILEGAKKDHVVTFDNDLVLLDDGDIIYVNRLEHIDGTEYFVFKDVAREGALLTLFILFAALLLAFAGFQGMRALLSLLISLAAIVFVLVPLLLAGYSPVLTSISIAAVVLASALFFTHGVTARATLAFLGTMGAVIVTGILASVWVSAAKLTGFGSDAAIYLNFSTQGTLDFGGLLLGSIIIGVLGVLDDVAITQASVVRELKAANATLGAYELYRRALRVGRDHVGSLVNTLALAYVGVSLPLVLLYSRAGTDFVSAVNQEIMAAELVRIMVGSIGLVLAVPITTALASWWFSKEDALTPDPHAHVH